MKTLILFIARMFRRKNRLETLSKEQRFIVLSVTRVQQ